MGCRLLEMVLELLANTLDSLSNHRSKLHERFLAKERVEGLSPFLIKVMFYNFLLRKRAPLASWSESHICFAGSTMKLI